MAEEADDIDLWLDGALPPERLPAFLAGLRADRDLRRELLRRARFAAQLVELVRARDERHQAGLSSGQVSAARRKRHPPIAWWMLGTGAAAAAVLAFLLLRPLSSVTVPAPSKPPPASPTASVAPAPTAPPSAARVAPATDALIEQPDAGTLQVRHGRVAVDAEGAPFAVRTPQARIAADDAVLDVTVRDDASFIDVARGWPEVAADPVREGRWSAPPMRLAAGAAVRVADGHIVPVPPRRWSAPLPGLPPGWTGAAAPDGIAAIRDPLASARHHTALMWVATPNRVPLVRADEGQAVEIALTASATSDVAVTLVCEADGAWIGNLRTAVATSAGDRVEAIIPLSDCALTKGRRPPPDGRAAITRISIITGEGVDFVVHRLAIITP